MPTPSQESITTTSMFVSFYGWTDNNPAGASIAYPKLHSSAGGRGTYSDLAVDTTPLFTDSSGCIKL
ncbi:MAG TPA: hypothetical protein VGL94_17820 [Ktedonobacteraceae bacterium]